LTIIAKVHVITRMMDLNLLLFVTGVEVDPHGVSFSSPTLVIWLMRSLAMVDPEVVVVTSRRGVIVDMNGWRGKATKRRSSYEFCIIMVVDRQPLQGGFRVL